MTEAITKLPVKNAQTPPSVGHPLRPFLGLRQEIERLLDEFDRGSGPRRSGARCSNRSGVRRPDP
jgi:hypothetical protein